MLLQVSLGFLLFHHLTLSTQGTCQCGGCYYHSQYESLCRSRCTSFPNSCWLLANCFQAACRNRGYLNGCFNGFCDVGENVESCPSDCCIQRNPQKCARVQGVCPPQCCGESNCCVEEEKPSKSGAGAGMIVGCLCGGIFGCLCISLLSYRVYIYYKDGNRVIPAKIIPWTCHE